MDHIKKFLKKLSGAKQSEVRVILRKIKNNKTKELNIKRLKGYKSFFRVRAGDIRIVFAKNKKKIHILFVGHRGDSKYKKF